MAIVSLRQADAPAASAAPPPPTEHQLLCASGERWLRRSVSKGGHGCQVTVTEGWANWSGERPDVIGWRTAGHQDGSVVLEIKVTRADFLADGRKEHRQDPERGVGKWRYYLCPEGLIQPGELPPRWGLLWSYGRSIRVLVGAATALSSCDGASKWERYAQALEAHAFHERDHEREVAMLARLHQRVPDARAAHLRIREISTLNGRLVRELERLRARCRDLEYEVMRLRCPDGTAE